MCEHWFETSIKLDDDNDEGFSDAICYFCGMKEEAENDY